MKLKILLTTLFSLFILSFFTSSCLAVQNLSSKIIFTELMPNPEGEDKNQEWITLKNNSKQTINLENWRISNKKDEYLTSSQQIEGLSSITIYPQKITLTNKSDSLTLFDPLGNTIDKVSYTSAPSGQSYILKNNNWSFLSEEKTQQTDSDNLIKNLQNNNSKKKNTTNYLIITPIAFLIILLLSLKTKSAPS